MAESDSSFTDSEYYKSSSDSEDNTNDTNQEVNAEEGEEEDFVVKAIKEELVRKRDHPPSIISEDFIVDICFHPAKNIIALGNILGDIHLYQYDNEETKLVNTHELHTDACRDVEFDNEGTTLFSAAKDLVIMATDVETGKLKRYYEKAHDDPVHRLISLDSDRIVTGDDGGTVKFWDMRKPDPIFSIRIGEEYVGDMITNDAQKYLVCADGDGGLTTLDLRARKIFTTSEGYDSDLTCMGLFRNDTKLLVGSSKGKLYLFNWKEFGLHSDEYIGQKHSISCMIPITQNIVITSGEDGVLRAAHMFPQRQLGIAGQHKLPVERLDISHDGQFVASCSHDNDVKFWNVSYFESIESIIDVNHKQDKKKDMKNNLPSSTVQNTSDFFSGLL